MAGAIVEECFSFAKERAKAEMEFVAIKIKLDEGISPWNRYTNFIAYLHMEMAIKQINNSLIILI